MINNRSILVIGSCGVGKTWLMRQIIERYKLTSNYKLGKFWFKANDKISVIGKFDNSTFQGTDRLSMSVLTDLDKYNKFAEKEGIITIFEGDRFTNSTLIGKNYPLIVKIDGNGEDGRKERKSNQSERHLKSIGTRVGNIKEDILCKNSTEALKIITDLIDK
jgi:GTPase SAR1 family protein